MIAAAGACGAADLRLVGSATLRGERLRLTPSAMDQVGAAWYPAKQFIRDGFTATFQFQLSAQGGLGPGADGFAFVLQNSGPDAIGNKGSAGGFGLGDKDKYPGKRGIPRSLAVFFDSYRNEYDASDNYIAICTNGTLRKMKWPPARLGTTKKLPFYMKDGQLHSVRLVYKPPVLTVWLDGDTAPVLSTPVDTGTVMDERGNAFVGFTASTGGGYQNHDILNWSLVADSSSLMTTVDSSIQFLDRITCMEDRNLCTPKEALVEEKSEKAEGKTGVYHVILPAHLAWAASVPNPAGKPVQLENIVGNICRDLKTRGPAGCSGPDPAQIAMKNQRGKTLFSVVNAATGNEGFFEFDVLIKP